MSDRPTPETDAFILANAGFGPTDCQWREHARRIERERDEARRNAEITRLNGMSVVKLCSRIKTERDEAREELQQWEMLCLWGGTPEHIDQFIRGQQSRIHEAQEVELVCEQLERERDEAREQNQAMREAIREALKAIVDLHNDDFPSGGDFSDTAIDAFNKGNAALAKLQPFIAP